MSILLAGGVLMLIGAAVWYGQLQQEERHARAASVAAQLGLRADGDELRGEWRGRAVRLYTKDEGGSGSTELWTVGVLRLDDVDLPAGLTLAPEGFWGHLADLFGQHDLRVGSALDALLRIGAVDAPAARELLRDERLERDLLACLRGGGRVELTDRELTVRHPGDHLDRSLERLEELVGLADALRDASWSPWAAAAERFGLQVRGDRGLVGGVSGVWLRARYRPGPHPSTVVSATVDPPLPAGTVVRGREGDDGDALGDLILDGRLAVTCPDLDALRLRICRDEVRGPLLDVLSGHPDAALLAAEVQLVRAGRLGERLPEALDLALELARALRVPTPG